MKKIFKAIFIFSTWLFSLTAFQLLVDTVDWFTHIYSHSSKHNFMQSKGSSKTSLQLDCECYWAFTKQGTRGERETQCHEAEAMRLLLLLLANKCPCAGFGPSHSRGQNAHPLSPWVLMWGPRKQLAGSEHPGGVLCWEQWFGWSLTNPSASDMSEAAVLL